MSKINLNLATFGKYVFIAKFEYPWGLSLGFFPPVSPVLTSPGAFPVILFFLFFKFGTTSQIIFRFEHRIFLKVKKGFKCLILTTIYKRMVSKYFFFVLEFYSKKLFQCNVFLQFIFLLEHMYENAQFSVSKLSKFALKYVNG